MESIERPFEPSLLTREAHAALCAAIRADTLDDPLRTSEVLRDIAVHADSKELDGLRLAVAASVLADLAEQGWRLRVASRKIFLRTPEPGVSTGEDLRAAKARHRSGLLMASDRQLASPSVQEFVRRVERDRVHNGRIVSIKTIVDDGQKFLGDLDKLADKGIRDEDALQRLIVPTLEPCFEGTKCRSTGIELLDIWRYFRHTWSLEYNSLPGRTLRVLGRVDEFDQA